jgi:uncharacterized membrane protein
MRPRGSYFYRVYLILTGTTETPTWGTPLGDVIAVSLFDAVQVLHVLSAALALGGLAALPFVAARVHGAGDERFASYGLSIMRTIELGLVWPAAAGIVGLGLAMVEGPIARFSFTAEGSGWLHVGTTLWTVLALALYGMARLRGGLVAEAEDGATGGDPVRRLWQGWTAAWALATLCIAGGVAVMSLRLGA